MIESESTLSDLLPNHDGPESPIRPERIGSSADSAGDNGDLQSSSKDQWISDTYANYFAPEERRKIAATLADPAYSLSIWFLLHRC